MKEFRALYENPVRQIRQGVSDLLNGSVKKYKDWQIPRNIPGPYVRLNTPSLGEWYIGMDDWKEFRGNLSEIPAFIGMGRERVVLSHPHDESKVISIFHESLEWPQIREKMALHKVLNILYPHNFPKNYAFFGPVNNEHGAVSQPKEFTGFISDFIEGFHAISGNTEVDDMFGLPILQDPFLLYYQDGKSSLDVKYPFNAVLKSLNSLGISINNLGFDYFEENFKLAPDGGEYYMDLLIGPYYANLSPENWDSVAIIRNLREQVKTGILDLSQHKLKTVESTINTYLSV